jgi:predicted nuclease of predicted toxin-antitoxin system
LKFLVDNQLPLALARWLEKRGLEVKHVLDVQLNEQKDPAIWQYAIANHFVIISKDEDFADWVHVRHPKTPVVWVRLGNCRNDDLFAAFTRALPLLVQRLEAGETLVEIY